MVGPKTSLRGFLRKDILKNRLKVPVDSIQSQHTLSTSPIATINEPPTEKNLFRDLFDDDEDYILLTPLQRLMSKSPQSMQSSPKKASTVKSSELESLRRELLMLVEQEDGEEAGELGVLRERRTKLIREITRLEGEEREEEMRGLRAKMDENRKTLPEPISPWEKKRLKWGQEKIAKALAGEEIPKPKSKKKREYIPDEELDGEDRLRLGKKIKRDPLLVGHWKSDTLFELFPSYQDHSVQELKDMVINSGKSKKEKEFLREEMERFKD